MAKNETILIKWNDCIFSENIYAYFEHGMTPVFSNRIQDLMLPTDEEGNEDYITQPHPEGSYEVFGYNKDAGKYLYTGRLFIPKGAKL